MHKLIYGAKNNKKETYITRLDALFTCLFKGETSYEHISFRIVLKIKHYMDISSFYSLLLHENPNYL